MKYCLVGIVCLLLAVASSSGYTIIGGEKSLILHSDGGFTAVEPGSISGALQSGEEVLSGYVLVRNDDGTLEYVQASTAYALEGDYGVSYKGYSSATECATKCTSTYANSYCKTWFGSNYILKSGSGPTCSGSICNWRCISSGTTCGSASDCSKSLSCEYCQMGTHQCVSGQCKYAVCGSRSECGVVMECDPNSADDGVGQAKDVCEERIARQYGDSRYVKSASCSSDGTAVCATDRSCTVECTKSGTNPPDPICVSKATAACAYGYTSVSCNIEKDCFGAIKCSTCKYACKSAPVTQICGDGKCTGTENERVCATDCRSSPAACGNGVCESGETRASCAADCGDPVVDPDPSPTCSAGYVGDLRCEGISLVRTYRTITCSEYDDVIQLCDIACVNGACQKEPVQDDCGDGSCGPTESRLTCPSDCQTPVCGDNVCDDGESLSCKLDCWRGRGPPHIDSSIWLIIAAIIIIAGIGLIYKLR